MLFLVSTRMLFLPLKVSGGVTITYVPCVAFIGSGNPLAPLALQGFI